MNPVATEGFLLSPQQRRVLATSVAGVSNRCLVLKASGALEIDTLRAALDRICARHEILRTCIESPGGSRHARQIIKEVTPDAGTSHFQLAAGPAEDAFRAQLLEEQRRVFDCEETPPWRMTLCRVSPTESCIIIAGSSLVMDWATLRLCAGELADACSGSLDSRDEPFQYADYATWQEDCRITLGDAELSPPSDTPPLFQGSRGAVDDGAWTESVALDDLLPGADNRMIEAICLSAAHVVTGRLAGHTQPVLGVVLDGRLTEETQDMMGPTEKIFPFDASLDQTFHSLQGVAQGWLEGGRLRFDRHFPDPGWLPDVRFQYVEMPGCFSAGGWSAEPVLWMDSLHSPERLGILCIRHERRLTVQIHARISLVDFSPEGFAEHFVRQLLHLCRAAHEAPDRRVLAIPFCHPEGSVPPPDLTQPIPATSHPPVTTAIHQWMTRFPDAVAISHLGREFSYNELWASGEAIAKKLVDAGLTHGDRVAIMGGKSFGTIASMLGSLLSGGVMVSLDLSLPAERRSAMVTAAAARFLLLIGEVEMPAWVAEACVIQVSPDGGVCEQHNKDAALPSLEPVAAEDPAYVFFTSGTSGIPKGILGNHRGLAHFIHWQGAEHGVLPGDRVAQLTALSFDVVLRDVFLPLCHGAVLCLPPADAIGSPPSILGWMKEERITVLHVVPSIATWWVGSREVLPELPALRWIFFAGEPLDASLIAQWRSRLGSHGTMVNLYGPTETTLAKCHYRIPQTPGRGIQPIGFPLPGTEVFLWNKEDVPCVMGEPGEIVIRTPFRTRGYLADHINGSSGFRPNPYRADPTDLLYRTGDVGRMRCDGSLEIEGRMDDLVKIRGVRVSPSEVEAHLAAHQDVERCVVLVARKEPQDTPSLLAFVISSKEETRRDGASLLQDMRRRLPLAMVPEKVVVLPRFPLTTNGKLDRQRLLELAGDSVLEGRPAAKPPADERQRIILAMWQDLFHRSDFGVDDNFFDLGGHSLLAAQLAARLRESFLRLLPLGVVFEAPTVEQLAVRLDTLPTLEERPGPATMAACENGTDPLSSSQRRIWLQHQLEPETGAYNIPLAVRITGDFDLGKFHQHLSRLLQRHAILRTVFMEVDGEPVQRALPDADLGLEFERVDFSSGSATGRNEMLRSRASADARRPFDSLDSRPPIRVVLAKMHESEHVLIITLHHLVGDGWSSTLLLRELATACNEDHAAAASPSEALTFQYADFARWEQSMRTPEALATSLHWWKQRLDGVARLPVFPTDHPRTLRQSRPGDEVTVRLSKALTDRVRQLGRSVDASLFMTLLAAFQAYLFRLTGQDDIVLGTPVANRPLPETEALIGCFINTLPLRAKVAGKVPFDALLQSTRRQVLEDFQHLDCPYEEIVRVAQPVRRKDSHPLFQVLFNVLNFDPMPKSWPHLQFERIFPAVPGSKFDWTIYAREGSELELQFLYDAGNFDRTKMMARAAGFVDLLEQITEEPGCAIAAYHVDPAGAFTGNGNSHELSEVTPETTAHPIWDWSSQVHVENAVRTVWQRHLQVDVPLGADDDFFDLGGHSLLAMQMTHDLGRELGRAIPLRALFEHSTIRSLSSHLSLLVWHAGSGHQANEEWEV